MHRRLTRILAATALLLAGGVLTATPATAGTPDPAGTLPSRVAITDPDRTSAATVRVINPDRYVRMQPLTPEPEPPQIWRLAGTPDEGTQIISQATGNCLQVSPIADPVDSFVVQLQCDGLGPDRWRIQPVEGEPLVQIVNINTGLCLTQPPPVTFDTRLLVTRCLSGDEASRLLFRLIPVA